MDTFKRFLRVFRRDGKKIRIEQRKSILRNVISIGKMAISIKAPFVQLTARNQLEYLWFPDMSKKFRKMHFKWFPYMLFRCQITIRYVGLKCHFFAWKRPSEKLSWFRTNFPVFGTIVSNISRVIVGRVWISWFHDFALNFHWTWFHIGQ